MRTRTEVKEQIMRHEQYLANTPDVPAEHRAKIEAKIEAWKWVLDRD